MSPMPPMPPPGMPPAPPPPFLGASTMAASVVISRPATEAASCRAVRTTFAGSITPSFTRSPYSSVWALKPNDGEALSSTLPTTIEPSTPAFSAIWRIGACRARRTMAMPAVWSSLSPVRPSRIFDAFSRATPPPGTMPSSTAARVAFRASSTRSFFSFTSTSVEPPTRTTATPPASLARRSCSFSLSYSEVVSSIWARICLMRASILAFSPRPSTRVVSSLVMVTFLARPSISMETFSSLMPRSSETTSAPVRMARSSSMALRRSPKPGAFTAATRRPPARLHPRFQHRQQGLQRAELLLEQQDGRLFEDGLHLVGVGDEVGRQVAAVELHALDDVEFGFQRLGFLDRDDAFVADLGHRLGDHGADFGVAVGRDGADLGDLVVGGDLLGRVL